MNETEDLSLQNTFRNLECLTIILTVLTQACWIRYAIQFHWLIGISFGALALAFVLALVRPRSTRRRLLHILAQTLVMSLACSLGPPRRHCAYFLVLAAKSAALLPRKYMAIVVPSLLGAAIASDACAQYCVHELFVRRVGIAHFYNAVITETELKLYFLVGLITVIFLGRTVVSERRSRKEQQTLAREAESLALELERNRIAREIHDSLGHTLTSLLMQLELSVRLLEENKLDKAIELTSRCYDSVTSGLKEVRRTVKAIRSDEIQSTPGGSQP